MNGYFAIEVRKELSGAYAELEDKVVSPLLSMPYSTLFDMELTKEHNRGASSRKSVAEAHEEKLKTENSSLYLVPF